MNRGSNSGPYSGAQQTTLVLLRTLVGWHFLYEAYYKLMLPAWSADGAPLKAWSSAAYLKAATGPLAGLFHWMAGTSWLGRLDTGVKLGLLLVGLSLILGLFTRAGCWGALCLLALFYLAAIPMAGSPQPGNEGTYLIVNKTLIEFAAVAVLLTFNTGAIAGLDLLRNRISTASGSERDFIKGSTDRATLVTTRGTDSEDQL